MMVMAASHANLHACSDASCMPCACALLLTVWPYANTVPL